MNERLAGLFEDSRTSVERKLLLVVGHQRCGSTLVSQYLASALRVGYPSNLIARFWRAPLVGITLQMALAEKLAGHSISFESELGTTPGLLDPHEFSYFWNHWFPDEVTCRDPAGLRRAIGNMEAAFSAPMLFKNNFNSLRVGPLATHLPTSVFVHVRRDLVDIACSTLNGRRARYSSDAAWFGVRPVECADVGRMSPYEQIAAQIFHTQSALDRGLSAVPAERVVEVDYERFCEAPAEVADRLAALGIERRSDARAPTSFHRSAVGVEHPDAAGLRDALKRHYPDLRT